jgi:hypothetical protein
MKKEDFEKLKVICPEATYSDFACLVASMNIGDREVPISSIGSMSNTLLKSSAEAGYEGIGIAPHKIYTEFRKTHPDIMYDKFLSIHNKIFYLTEKCDGNYDELNAYLKELEVEETDE